ncbi:MAG: IS1 family transposase [Campylobacterota bacterium]|nr:IS1 family transposase [Campylobacterota bacterium]
MNKNKKYKKYRRLTEEEKSLIFKLNEENIGQRAIARVLDVYVRTVQYHLKKIVKYKKMYKDNIKLLKENIAFVYLIIDELYTFIGKKGNKAYIWSAIAVKEDGSLIYLYHLSKRKNNEALEEFCESLPDVPKVYCDGNMSYGSVFGEKATLEKSVFTNLIESLNSSLRSKISYLTRRSDKHSKSFDWLDYKLANFFYKKNTVCC